MLWLDSWPGLAWTVGLLEICKPQSKFHAAALNWSFFRRTGVVSFSFICLLVLAATSLLASFPFLSFHLIFFSFLFSPASHTNANFNYAYCGAKLKCLGKYFPALSLIRNAARASTRFGSVPTFYPVGVEYQGILYYICIVEMEVAGSKRLRILEGIILGTIP